MRVFGEVAAIFTHWWFCFWIFLHLLTEAKTHVSKRRLAFPSAVIYTGSMALFWDTPLFHAHRTQQVLRTKMRCLSQIQHKRWSTGVGRLQMESLNGSACMREPAEWVRKVWADLSWPWDQLNWWTKWYIQHPETAVSKTTSPFPMSEILLDFRQISFHLRVQTVVCSS